MKKIKLLLIALTLLILFSPKNIFSQQVNGGNLKVICNWTNGCDDPKACCKVHAGGKKCDDYDWGDKVRCNENADPPVTTNCWECEDLKVGTNSPITNEYVCGIHEYDETIYSVRANAQSLNGTIRVYNSIVSYETVIDFNNMTISDSGVVFWFKGVSNILTLYTAQGSSWEEGLYQHASLDSILIDLDTLFSSGAAPNNEQLSILYQHWLDKYISVTVSPNPASTNFNIELKTDFPPMVSNTSKFTLEFYSSDGKLISTQSVKANGTYKFVIPAEYYSNGFIFYRLNWNTAYRTGKVVIIK